MIFMRGLRCCWRLSHDVIMSVGCVVWVSCILCVVDILYQACMCFYLDELYLLRSVGYLLCFIERRFSTMVFT